jgi:hypothetical protein
VTDEAEVDEMEDCEFVEPLTDEDKDYEIEYFSPHNSR